MYDIIFYQSPVGKSEVMEYIRELKKKKDKNSRINFNKIVAYLDLLEEIGTRIGEPVTKHLDGEIWELRPLKNRILYAYCEENAFIILTQFRKKTQKAPAKEIERAKRYLADYLERKRENECKLERVSQ